MLKNVLSNGYTSQVRGWLVIGESRHELAQVGPTFCILREPISDGSFSSIDTPANLVVEIDGDQREVAIILSSSNPTSTRLLQYRGVYSPAS